VELRLAGRSNLDACNGIVAKATSGGSYSFGGNSPDGDRAPPFIVTLSSRGRRRDCGKSRRQYQNIVLPDDCCLASACKLRSGGS
jgi:hypothetical protein